LVVLLGVLAATTAGALANTGSPVHWGDAIKVPGTDALNVGGYASVTSVSCAGAGECAAGGFYWELSAESHAFVVSEQGGVWGTAIEVPGLAALVGVSHTEVHTHVSSVSCGSPGNCAAGGFYWHDFVSHAFVVAEQGGVWGTAMKVPGMEAVYSVSCGGPDTCTALGSSDWAQRFVVSEHGGVWGPRRNIPGDVNSVSCGGVDSCVAVGSTQDDNGVEHGFLVVERDGRWGNGQRVPGMWTLSAGSTSKVESVSCTSPGNCAVAGHYLAGRRTFVFAMDERNGKWGRPITVRGVKGYAYWPPVSVTSVSCSSAGNCAAGGNVGPYPTQSFVVREVKGKWGWAIRVKGLPRLHAGDGSVTSVSCAGPGNCVAVGYYFSGTDNRGEAISPRAFAMTERNGAWGRAQRLRGLGPSVEANSVSCVRAGNCTIGGRSGGDGDPIADTFERQAFVTAP